MAEKIQSNQSPTTWRTVSLANYVPDGTTKATFIVKNTSSNNLDFHFRQTGAEEVAPIIILAGKSEMINIDLDSDMQFDFYVSEGGAVDIWLLSSYASALGSDYTIIPM